MSTVKNTIIASTLALAGLFSASAGAGTMPLSDIVSKSDTILAQAIQSPNAVFNQCVRENFVREKPDVEPPLQAKLYDGLLQRIAYGLVDDDTTFAISVNSMLKKACSDSQMAGGAGKQPK